jgi:hypothetical protein
MVRLEGLDKLKKNNNLIGNRIRDLLACSIVAYQLRYRVPLKITILTVILYECNLVYDTEGMKNRVLSRTLEPKG